jgi:hypothetical protein
MNYIDDYHRLNQALKTNPAETEIDGMILSSAGFRSLSHNILPGNPGYHCQKHGLSISEPHSYYNDIGTLQDDIHITDAFVEENRHFSYHMLRPKGNGKARHLTLLFHGFNEKNWPKYLPWAKAICLRTNSTVVLFPIAFHMQRGPSVWSDKRKMFASSEARKLRFPNIISSTLTNVAISMRLHSMPQRFIWSGLQTYYDLIQFIEDIRAGGHPQIDKNFTFNIFAYSVGGLLAEILKLSNYKDYFRRTKVCLFCSGAVFNRLSPVSKYILDSEANVALYSYLVEHFDSFLRKDRLLRHFIEEDHPEGKVFRSMLDFAKMRDFREDLFRRYEQDFYAITLRKDTVIPSFEVINTLQGAFRDISIRVEEFDFDHHYTHENPFPLSRSEAGRINANFAKVFDAVGDFFEKT